MVCAGNQQSFARTPIGGLTAIVDAGFTVIAVGIGFRIIPGVGRHSIMAAGYLTPTTDGSGRRIAPGDRPGFRGGIHRVIVVGRRCRRKRVSRLVLALPFIIAQSVSILNSDFGRIIIISFRSPAFVIIRRPATGFHPCMCRMSITRRNL